MAMDKTKLVFGNVIIIFVEKRLVSLRLNSCEISIDKKTIFEIKKIPMCRVGLKGGKGSLWIWVLKKWRLKGNGKPPAGNCFHSIETLGINK